MLVSSHRHYLERSPVYYIEQARKRSHALERLISRNFEVEEIPERIYRRCDGLLSLQRKTHPLVFEKACVYALQQDLLSCKSLQRILETKAYEWSENKEEVSEGDEPRATHQNIRGKQYYINQIHQ